MSIDGALANLSTDLLRTSGSIFYTGRTAFTKLSELYILGLNPGGSPILQVDETIGQSLAKWEEGPWSAYLDESWQGAPPGTHGLQPRIRHMFDQLGLDLRDTPASNVVFVRSATEAALEKQKSILLAQCWPVHLEVLRATASRTILCLGGTAGRWVRQAIQANELLDRFAEKNSRGWVSEAHIARDGCAVLTLTHPGRADWRNPTADPTPLVRAVIGR